MSSKRTWSAYENESDETPFAHFGTPLLNSEHDRGAFVPLHLQEARDEKGRRQFHGAFTGGWSAGYFNTVGSKGGWTPSTFVSSRANRVKAGDAAFAQQRPEDFMDSEDLSDAKELRRLQTVHDFSSFSSKSLQVDPLGLGLEAADTAGSRLLRRMGWKPGQGIGPKVIRAARLGSDHILGPEVCTDAQEFLFAPPDVSMITVSRKSNIHGLGYDQEDDAPPLHTTSVVVQDQRTSRRKRLHMDYDKANSPSSSEDQSVPLTGVSLGEDSDDDLGPRISYGKAKTGKNLKKPKKKALSVISSKSTAKRNPNILNQSLSLSQILPGFVLPLRGPSQTSCVGSREFDPPAVPSDWISKIKETSKALTKEAHTSSSTSLQTPQRRGDTLGEQQLPSQSIFDFISPEARARLALVSGKTNLPAAGGKSLPASNSGALKIEDIYTQSPSLDRESALAALTRTSALGGPYHNDEAKLGRYMTYLKFQAKQSGVPELPPGLSLAELKIELAEFYNCARIFKPMTGLMATRFAPSSNGGKATGDGPSATAAKPSDAAAEAAKIGMYGNLTRSVLSFTPSRILYKRFNIPAPAHVQTDSNTDAQDGPTAFPMSEADTMPPPPPPKHTEQNANETSAKGASVLDRPPDDVFRSIFGDDDV